MRATLLVKHAGASRLASTPSLASPFPFRFNRFCSHPEQVVRCCTSTASQKPAAWPASAFPRCPSSRSPCRERPSPAHLLNVPVFRCLLAPGAREGGIWPLGCLQTPTITRLGSARRISAVLLAWDMFVIYCVIKAYGSVRERPRPAQGCVQRSSSGMPASSP